MTLIHKMHGGYCGPLRQARRATDGVRGVFVRRPVSAGEKLLAIPLLFCSYPNGGPAGKVRCSTSLYSRPLQECDDTVRTQQQQQKLRWWSRNVALFPEMWQWLQRLSPDASGDIVSLQSLLSSHSESGAPVIVTLNVSPVEAALAMCVGLRYFFSSSLHLSQQVRARTRIGPLPHDVADAYVASLPMKAYLQRGVEAEYFSNGGHEQCVHSCLEEITWNLRDAALVHASAEEYRRMDEHPSALDSVLLAALYIVRARVMHLPVLLPTGGEGNTSGSAQSRVLRTPAVVDPVVSIFAPALDGLNHCNSPLCSAAAAVSPHTRSVVVRTTRSLLAGEEVTLDYLASAPAQTRQHEIASSSNGGELIADDWWESRYLLGEES